MKDEWIGTYLYVPDNFDVDRFIKECPPVESFRKPPFRKEDLLYLISRLIEVPHMNRNTRDENGFIRLKAEYLQAVVPKYKYYLEYLTIAGVIEIEKQYIVGSRSRAYKFCEPFFSATGIKEIPIAITSRLYAPLEKQNSAEKEIADQQYPYLIKWFDQQLSIKFEEANQIIKRIHELRRLQKKEVKDKTTERLYEILISPMIEYLTREERNSFHRAIRPIYDYKFGLLTFRKKLWRFKVDETVHRFHSNITNLKSELRYCLQYNGQEMVCLDIKNCQPYLSLLLFSPTFYTDNTQLPISPNNTTSPPHTHYTSSFNIHQFPSIHQSITLQPNKQSLPIMISILDFLSEKVVGKDISEETSDFSQFRKHVADGSLYNYIGQRLEEEGLYVPANRKELKVMIFLTFFTKNGFLHQKEAEPKKLFTKLFPTVAKLFELIKTNDPKTLPILLQQIESRLFLDRITKRIASEMPELPIYTVHDSIITLKGAEMYVENVIKVECEKVIGIPPAVDITYYDDLGLKTILSQLEQKIRQRKAAPNDL